MQIVEELLHGNPRALAKAITLIENDVQEKEDILGQIFQHTGHAYVVGITGSPGAGKSSLADKLIGAIRRRDLKVGVLAIDPTSPFTGGALLGDRIRMQEHVLDKDVYIRSMGTRGSMGGLAKATKEAIKVLDAFGKDIILVETVGVGQSELDVMRTVDTTVVVLTPGAGDVIQTMKAGIMEIADVFAINKADMEGADRLAMEVENMLDLGHNRSWRPPVVKTVSLTGEGVDELLEAIDKHRHYLEESGGLQEIREKRLRSEVVEIVLEEMRRQINDRFQDTAAMEQLFTSVAKREVDPYAAARRVLNVLKN